VLSEIANAFLPDIARSICLSVVGDNNKEICNYIYTGIDFITSLSTVGNRSYKLINELVHMSAYKGAKKSVLYFAAHTAELAYNIKNVLEAYKKLGIIDWDRIDYEDDNGYSKQLYYGTIIVSNKTNKHFTIQISKDGQNWNLINIAPGNWKEIEFWNNQNNQSYGFIKGNDICNYQLYTNKKYNIRYNNYNKSYEIELYN
jgi:hypothetical protein